MSVQELIIEGARQNNLKNLTLSIPHNKVIAVTGVSGSGKSSLAFDTIFAEGHWRFIESLSSYARLFLEKLDRPDVDNIFNIRPAIALEQKNPIRGSRSTVGTLTELYDLFRVLYAKVAVPYCPQCGREINKWDPSAVKTELVSKHYGEKAIILFDTVETPDDMLKKGFHRIWQNREIHELSRTKQAVQGTLTIVLDRLIIRDDSRLSDSVETAWKMGHGKMQVAVLGAGGPESPVTSIRFSSENSCDDCEISLPEPSPALFSFNHPAGACPVCKGFGDLLQYDEDIIIPDKDLSLSKGAVDPWNKPAAGWWKKHLMTKGKKAGLDLDKPYSALTPEEKLLLFKGGSGFYGIDDFFEDLENRRYKLHVRVFLSRYRRSGACHACNGKRLNKEMLAYKISGLDIAELSSMTVRGLAGYFSDLNLSAVHAGISKELLNQINMKLKFLSRVGLDYLTLIRNGKTLSGGEYQRINLSNQLSSLLAGTLYVLDEPTIGLHPRDTDRISDILKSLSELGNTVVVVEHDRGIIETSDWIIELGPGGGHRGGNLIFSGRLDDFLKTDTLTSRYLNNKENVQVLRAARPSPRRFLVLSDAAGNNLKQVTLNIPLNLMTAVTGVSGSGKSSLIVETLYRALGRHFRTETEQPLPFRSLGGAEHLKGIRLIDQSPIGRSPRSNPVTYLKIFDYIRKIFAAQKEARAYGYGPGFFSFNVAGGRCEACKGGGVELMEMFFFEDLYITCERCEGMRYKPDALRVMFNGRNIHDVLGMTVEEAAAFFHDHAAVRNRLNLLIDTGLGYLRLGQSATTLSGGEAQRLKICAELQKAGMNKSGSGSPDKNSGYLYILDEPTVGLHFEDVKALLRVLNRLVDAGNTVVVIEHNPDVIRAADWIVDIGPEGGDRGGKIIFEGRPHEIVSKSESYTGTYLKRYSQSS